LIELLLINSSLSQLSKKDDFRAGHIKLGEQCDSTIALLGKPDSTVLCHDIWEGYTAYYYSKIIVWEDNDNSLVHAFEIGDPKYVTSRGLKIGDDLIKIEKLYPRKLPEHNFHRLGPYNKAFKDYSEFRLYDYNFSEIDGWVLILFTKNCKLVKMLFYVGIPE